MKIKNSNRNIYGAIAGILCSGALVFVSLIQIIGDLYIIPAAIMIVASILLVNKLHSLSFFDWYHYFVIGFIGIIIVALAAAACVMLAANPAPSNASVYP